jgi:hypothetical protein
MCITYYCGKSHENMLLYSLYRQHQRTLAREVIDKNLPSKQPNSVDDVLYIEEQLLDIYLCVHFSAH